MRPSQKCVSTARAAVACHPLGLIGVENVRNFSTPRFSSFDDFSNRSDVQVRRSVVLHPSPPLVAPSSPADDSLVRVWPSSRQLGPSPRRVLSGHLGSQGVPLRDSGRPHLPRSGCEGQDERLCP